LQERLKEEELIREEEKKRLLDEVERLKREKEDAETKRLAESNILQSISLKRLGLL